jgi:hypothetical protein
MIWSLWFVSASLSATEIGRDKILETLRAEPLLTVAPGAEDPYAEVLTEAEKWATTKPDEELTRAVLQFQLRRMDPEYPQSARVLGQIFLAQSDTFLNVWNSLPGLQQRALGPYLWFGWKRAIEGKNKSAPRLMETQRKMDRLLGALTNAR